MNRLFYGDNLDILSRGYIARESVDLIYLDPPFNSQREYNLIFREASGEVAESQQQAFLDSWDWSQASETYEALVNVGGSLAEVVRGFHVVFGPSDFMAYLAMMGARLVALHGVLKPTGTIYLHCDPAASHYIKVMMDGIFGYQNFRNEIIWQRTLAKSLMTRQLPTNHDVILAYQRGNKATWNGDALFQPYDVNDLDEKTSSKYKYRDANGRIYRLDNLCNPNHDRPNLAYDFLGVRRVWRWTKDRMEAAYDAGLVVQTKPGAVPQLKRYLDEQRGRPFGDVWTDIPPLNSQATERKRIGYPTQKPLALLERILKVSTNQGDVVLDPFCGCGTTIAAAHRLNRHWIGIDITARAIDIIIERLRNDFGAEVDGTYGIEQYPYSTADARRLARENPFQFQRWALERLGVNPSDIKPGADRGIDGKLYFADGISGRTKRVVLSVKGGSRVTPRDVRELRGVLDRDGFQIGVLVSAENPSSAALDDLASGVRHYEAADGRLFPRLQSLTVDDIFEGRGVDYPDAGRHRVRAVPGAALSVVEAETPWLDFDTPPSTTEPIKIATVAKRMKKQAKASLPAVRPQAAPARARRGR